MKQPDTIEIIYIRNLIKAFQNLTLGNVHDVTDRSEAERGLSILWIKKFQLPFLEGRLNYLFIPYIENITKYIIIV